MGWVESAAHPSVRDIPEPVEQDMDGEVDIPIEPVSDTYDWDAGFTLKIPGFYRTEPAVAEAERVVRSRR